MIMLASQRCAFQRNGPGWRRLSSETLMLGRAGGSGGCDDGEHMSL
jgi:hypothetical protein